MSFENWLKNFLKRPILVEQEAQIICAMLDGTLNKEGAKKVYQFVIEQNLKSHKELMAMSLDEILDLAKRMEINIE